MIELRVLTFNIRYDNPADGPYAWEHRRERVGRLLQSWSPDLILLQEVVPRQRAELERMLPEYAAYGVGRDDGAAQGESVPIFFKRARWVVEEQGCFWLSETPHLAGSRGWDAKLPRITTRLKLREQTSGATLCVYNTHLEYHGTVAREQSACLLAQRVMSEPAEELVLLGGDFNSGPQEQPHQILWATGQGELIDTRSLAPHCEGPDSTWNGFERIEPGRRIDFIYARGPMEVRRHVTIAPPAGEPFPSDHQPVVVDLVWG